MYTSLPAWERGLKLLQTSIMALEVNVAPCVGAWIETSFLASVGFFDRVAPCVGAWIETAYTRYAKKENAVAPCVGAWIETLLPLFVALMHSCRSLRGSVD